MQRVLSFISLLMLLSCGKSETNFLTEAAVSDSYISMIRMLNFTFDSLAGELESGDNTCTLEVDQTCDTSNDTQASTFSACKIAGFTIDGTASISYSPEAACTATDTANAFVLSTTETATRTVNYTQEKSNDEFTLVGTNSFDRNGTNYEFELDLTKTYKRTGTTIYTQNIDTTGELVLNSMTRAGRILSTATSLKIRIEHNSDYIVDYTPNNVTWTSSCCHPTSGSMTISATGTIVNATGTITFTSTCGDATVELNDATSTVNLGSCY
jgi:hypothetical protein